MTDPTPPTWCCMTRPTGEDAMSEMTDERAAEVLAAHNAWRRYKGNPFDSPEMGDPAEIGRAIDHAERRLREQPPAEPFVCTGDAIRCHDGHGCECAMRGPQPPADAQPVAWQFQDRDGRWHGFLDERHRLNTIEDGSWPIRALYAHPPPSAPVGVEAALRDALQGLIDFIEIDNLPMDADAMFIAKRALAQQPAAVDGAGAKDAEIEALRVRADAMAGEAIKHEARAERLAEALRELVALGHPRDPAIIAAKNALRDHDQEVGNG